MIKRIGILTGGGDVPGLNPCITAIVSAADALGWETVGFKRGWAGPLHVDPADDAASRAEWSVLSDRKQGNRGNGAVRPNSGLDPVRSGLRSR